MTRPMSFYGGINSKSNNLAQIVSCNLSMWNVTSVCERNHTGLISQHGAGITYFDPRASRRHKNKRRIENPEALPRGC